MSKTRMVSRGVPNGTGPGKSGVKNLPQTINMHYLDKPIVQSGPKLGSNKDNKASKIGK